MRVLPDGEAERRRAAEASLATPALEAVPGFAGAAVFRPNGPLSAPRTAGRRGSSEDDLPLRLNHAQDRGVGRGLNPAPDEHGPAAFGV